MGRRLPRCRPWPWICVSMLYTITPTSSPPRGSNVHVEDRGPLVARCNRLVGIVGELCTADYMAPEYANSVAALDGDHFGGYGLLEVEVAGDVCIVDLLQRIIGCCCSDTDCFAVVGAIDAVSVSLVGGQRVVTKGGGWVTGHVGQWCALI